MNRIAGMPKIVGHNHNFQGTYSTRRFPLPSGKTLEPARSRDRFLGFSLIARPFAKCESFVRAMIKRAGKITHV
jgi:hypothetical protein